MIVKNETECLRRAIADWRALADELIIVDTGSTDDTRVIAEAAGARVLHYDWQPPGHKGEARNVGVDAAAGDWIIILDADEIIRDAAGLRAFLLHPSMANGKGAAVEGGGLFDGLCPHFENYDPQTGAVTLRWTQLRIFRRGRYRYIHREHEMPQPVGEGPHRQSAITTVFEHRPPPGRETIKHESMLARLRLDVEEHPDDPHPLYFLHRQYAIAQMWSEAIQFGRHFLHVANGLGLDPCETYGNLAVAHLGLGEHQAAISYLHQALVRQPQRRVWWVRLAEVYHGLGQNNIALAFLRAAAELLPAAEPQELPQLSGTYLYELIQHCQAALAAGGEHHHHG